MLRLINDTKDVCHWCQLSNEKPRALFCWLGFIGDEDFPSCIGDCDKPLQGSLLNNQYNGSLGKFHRDQFPPVWSPQKVANSRGILPR